MVAPPLKRHEALRDWSRDHHLFLVHARDIEWYVTGDRHAQPVDAIARALFEFWEQRGLLHLREEEEILLPAYASHDAEAQQQAAHIIAEHDWLRANMIELRQSYDSRHPEFERLLAEVGQHLHDYVRYQERVVFQRAQQVLSEAELTEIGERLRK